MCLTTRRRMIQPMTHKPAETQRSPPSAVVTTCPQASSDTISLIIARTFLPPAGSYSRIVLLMSKTRSSRGSVEGSAPNEEAAADSDDEGLVRRRRDSWWCG